SQLSQRGVGRDDTGLQKSAKLYDELLQKYPESFFAAAGRSYRDEVRQNLAEYEDDVAAFYRKRNKPDAAAARERFYQEKWQPLLAEGSGHSTPAPSEQHAALERIAAELGPISPPTTMTDTTRDINGSHGSKGSKSTLPLSSSSSLQEKPGTSSGAKGGTLSRMAQYYVSKVECSGSSGTLLALYLNKEIVDERSVLTESKVNANGSNSTTIKVAEATAQPQNQICPDGSRVSLAADGTVRVEGHRGSLSMVTLGNPARVVVLTSER
ncbi:MAG: outer membrane protein assembly factor BamD, partial [Proteobacteria bacterium]|nr:outer membrane protein assembly factor BamD [Pseudomonadota bacterium]